MGVDRNGFLAEGLVEHDIGGLAPDPGQRFERGAVMGHLAAMTLDQLLRHDDDIPGLVAEQADRLDTVADMIFAERQHFFRRVRFLEQ